MREQILSDLKKLRAMHPGEQPTDAKADEVMTKLYETPCTVTLGEDVIELMPRCNLIEALIKGLLADLFNHDVMVFGYDEAVIRHPKNELVP